MILDLENKRKVGDDLEDDTISVMNGFSWIWAEQDFVKGIFSLTKDNEYYVLRTT